MGLIRGGLLVVICVMFFIFALVGNALLTLAWSMEYETIKPKMVSVVNDVLSEYGGAQAIIGERFPIMQAYCQNNTDYVFLEAGYTFTISCDVVGQGEQAVVDRAIENLIEKSYYQEYNCDFWDCFKATEQPLFLVSEKAYNYWISKFYLCITALVILFALGFILIEKRTNYPFIIGSLLILSGLPFLKLEWFLSLFLSFLLGELSKLLAVLFSESYSVFLRVAILGAVFILLGIFLKFFKAGFKISSVFSRIFKRNVSKEEVKEIVKKEVKKEKEESKKGKK